MGDIGASAGLEKFSWFLFHCFCKALTAENVCLEFVTDYTDSTVDTPQQMPGHLKLLSFEADGMASLPTREQ